MIVLFGHTDFLRLGGLACSLAVRLSVGLLFSACGEGAGGVQSAAPGEQLPGGETTNTLLQGRNAFTRHVSNISEGHESAFFAGNALFNQPWVTAPSSTDGRDGLGPLFNARSCAACHFKDGRGRPPVEPNEAFVGLLLRLSVPGEEKHGAARAEASYGGQLQPFSLDGVPAEGSPRVTYEELKGKYDDGAPYTLLQPMYEIRDPAYGDLDAHLRISPRVAPAMIGLGLLEALSEERLKELADPDDENDDGISGRIARVPDALTGKLVAGRFGWKAEQPSVRQQSAGAFLGDMGITSSMFPHQDCTAAQVACSKTPSGGDPELPDEHLDRVELYGQLLAVPVRADYDSHDVLLGKELFTAVGCAGCHVPQHVTSEHKLPELEHQVIWPYTDLLLHDMGEGLSDHRPSYSAEGEEWRTPPLWGLRFYKEVNEHNRLLHDGRARGVAEAILWHGGEAEPSKRAFAGLTADERALLVKFVESL